MSNAKTVIAGCRIPSGLMLQLRDPENQQNILAEIRVEGSAQKDAPYYKPYHAGFTEIDAEHAERWEKWAKEAKFAPFVSGSIFFAKDRASAEAKARELELERTLLEGLDVSQGSKDPRMAQFQEVQKFKQE